MKYEIRYCVLNNKVFEWRIEGIYKTKLVADRHKRRLEKKYLGTQFKVKELMGN